ncbi:MAG: DNA methyltransferase, partial [Acidimicrobiales bacterium]
MTVPLSASQGGAAPLQGVFLDDNLRALRALPDACVDLVYIDPPFGTQQVRRLGSIRTGSGAKARKGFAGRTYQFEVVSTYCYSDDMALPEYLSFLYQRLAEIHRVLAPTGSIYLHLDFHAAHYARLLLDELFGPERFLNEVIWAYDYGG